MKERTLTVLADIDTDRLDDLRARLEDVDRKLANNAFPAFAEIETLHFASFVILEFPDGPPALVFEANFDGDTKAFIDALTGSPDGRTALHDIFSHCIGCPDSADRLGGFLLEKNIGANCYYVGCRGRTVRQVRQEIALRTNVQAIVDSLPLRQGGADPAPTPAAIHGVVRQRIGNAGLDTWQRPFLVRHGQEIVHRLWWCVKLLLWLYAIVVIASVVVLALLALAYGWQASFGDGSLTDIGCWLKDTWHLTRRLVLAGVAVALILIVFLVIPLVVFLARLRRREKTDSEFKGAWDSIFREQIVAREFGRDNIQNHFCSLTKVKPGGFRRRTLQVVLWLINFAGRIYWNRGRLGEIPTIHFARWVIIPRDGAHWLLFLTNYGDNWDSYLNDFIDRASNGVTAIWSNTEVVWRTAQPDGGAKPAWQGPVGFPRSKFLILEGSRNEQPFKNYARNSQPPTRAWYQAYPTMTVRNVNDNTRQREAFCARPGAANLHEWLRQV